MDSMGQRIARKLFVKPIDQTSDEAWIADCARLIDSELARSETKDNMFWPNEDGSPEFHLYEIRHGKNEAYVREHVKVLVEAELARERDAGWVSVSERMPTEHGEYWVWLIPHPPQPSSLDPEHSVFLDFKPYAGIMKTYDSGKGMRFNCGAIEKPTHWMKFNRPAPPACGTQDQAKGGDL